MRVKIVTTGSFPDGMASTYRIYCYAKGLQEAGIPIQVISSNLQKVKIGKQFGYQEQIDGIDYTILWNRGRFKIIVLNYLWQELSSYILLFHCLLSIRKFDLIWIYGMGLIPRLILIPIIHFFGKKVILELNEYPYATDGNRYTRIPTIRKILQKCTLSLVFPQVDGFIVISENLNKLVNNHAPKANTLKIPILLVSKVENIGPDIASRKVLNNGTPFIFHAGALSEQKDGIDKLFLAYAKAAIKLQKSGFKLDLIITNKSTHPRTWRKIKIILKKYGLSSQLKITGFLSKEELELYLKHSKVLIINKPINIQNKYNFPTKLGEYLLSGRPVIAASTGLELNHYLKAGLNGIVVDSDDSNAIANAIVKLCSDEDLAKKIGNEGAKTALDQFDYRVASPRISSFLKKMYRH